MLLGFGLGLPVLKGAHAAQRLDAICNGPADIIRGGLPRSNDMRRKDLPT